MWAHNPKYWDLRKFAHKLLRDEHRKIGVDMKLARLAEHGSELRRMQVEDGRTKWMWGLAVIHCFRNPFSHPRFDVYRRHAEYTLTTMSELCFPNRDAARFAADLLFQATREGWLKEICVDRLRFTVKGFQFLYPFTRGRSDSTFDLIELEAFVDIEGEDSAT